MITDYFVLLEEIGRGSYATVWSAKATKKYESIEPGSIVAVKSVHRSCLENQTDQANLESEISIMKSMNHPNIVKLYGVIETEKDINLIIEYCDGGDLNSLLKSHTAGVPEKLVQDLTIQVTSALLYMRSLNIVHRDFKPHNILLSGAATSRVFKIADFGFAKFMPETDLTDTICGSPYYMAPEVQFGEKYTPDVDLWSLGIIIFELITTKIPYASAKNQYEIAIELTKRGSNPYRLPADTNVTQELFDLVEKLLTINPLQRITLAELAKHPFLQIEIDSPTDTARVSKRPKKFSFNYGLLSHQPTHEDILDSIIAIEPCLASSQMYGLTLKFDMLLLLSEMIIDLASEIGTEMPSKLKIELAKLGRELKGIDRSCLAKSKRSAAQHLYLSSLVVAEEGLDKQNSGNIEIAALKYRKAMNMLFPIVHMVRDDEATKEARIIYRRLMTACEEY